jgi:hypothetical protein
MGYVTFSQHQRYAGSSTQRVYRNVSMAAILGVFAAVVLGLILKSAFTGHHSTAGLRIFATALAVLLGTYVLRAMLVELRIGPEGVRIRNVFTTRRIPWSEITTVKPIEARGSGLSPGATVAFYLSDGRVLRPMALRRSLGDAIVIAKDLAHFAETHGAPTTATSFEALDTRASVRLG